MTWVDLLGGVAACFTTGCFVPQAYKLIRTKDTKSISLLMYAMFTTGVCLWLIYGIILESPPLIIANIVTLVLAVTILVTKIKYG